MLPFRFRHRHISARILLPILILLAVSCAKPPPPPRNVVVIVIDTLRADHLGFMGSPIPTSPSLDRFASQAVFVERCYTVSPWTLPTIATMHTGLYPSHHGATGPKTSLSPEAVTLAEMLSERGYRTAGVISQFFLRGRYGLKQGFDTYSESEARDTDHVSSENVTRQAREILAGLANAPEPFYLFVHYFDPHSDYMRHPQYALAKEPAGRLRGGEDTMELRKIAEDMQPHELDFLRGIYNEEVRWTDEHVGELLSAIEELGIEDETLIILTSDHGEEFQSRGRWIGHCTSMYEEVLRVPLIIFDPRAKEPGRMLQEPISLVDLAPTVLDLLGLEIEGMKFQGQSFAPRIFGRPSKGEGSLYFETDFVPVHEVNKEKESHRRAVIRDNYKMIRDLDTGSVELYDLAADPAERNDLSRERPEIIAQHAGDLDGWMTLVSEGALTAQEVQIPQRSLDQLRALGYAAR